MDFEPITARTSVSAAMENGVVIKRIHKIMRRLMASN